jgi:hypothetical protein
VVEEESSEEEEEYLKAYKSEFKLEEITTKDYLVNSLIANNNAT